MTPLENRLWKACGGVILSGPFRGLRYVKNCVMSYLGPKLLGSYESELGGVINNILKNPPTTVVNIGAGEGYYTAGLASLLPRALVIAFEAWQPGQGWLRTLLKQNNISNVRLYGRCEPHNLRSSLQDPKTLIWCDVEGYERTLLDPKFIPMLQTLRILVEIHEGNQIIYPDRRGSTEGIIRNRFQHTHAIHRIAAKARHRVSNPPRGFSASDIQKLAWERPLPMCWLWMEPTESKSFRVQHQLHSSDTKTSPTETQPRCSPTPRQKPLVPHRPKPTPKKKPRPSSTASTEKHTYHLAAKPKAKSRKQLSPKQRRKALRRKKLSVKSPLKQIQHLRHWVDTVGR